MFAVLLSRYLGAHKVLEDIDMFYKREYGFKVDLVGFQNPDTSVVSVGTSMPRRLRPSFS